MVNEITGFGPLQPLLDDPGVDDVIVNGPRTIYVERKGELEPVTARFRDTDHLMNVIQRIVAPIGRRIDEANPYVDGRLPDGSRLNVVIPPVALDGPHVSIRKFKAVPFTGEDLVRNGSMTVEGLRYLSGAVRNRRNILISGGTGSGKTTLLNVLSSYVGPKERIVTIEDTAELRLQMAHVVRMETRTPTSEGLGTVTARDLVRNALRMRPDRIILGEVRGGEALDMLQAMNTGHEGSLTTIHANDARDEGLAGWLTSMGRIGNTLVLTAPALSLSMLLALVLGSAAAVKKDRVVDVVVRAFAAVCGSVPAFHPA